MLHWLPLPVNQDGRACWASDDCPNCVCNNISVSFGPSGWVAVGQSFVVFSVIAGYPTNTWPCRDAVLVRDPSPNPVSLKRLGVSRRMAGRVVWCMQELIWPLCCEAPRGAL